MAQMETRTERKQGESRKELVMKYEFYRVEENVRYPETKRPAWYELEGWDDNSLERTIKDLDRSTGADTVLGDRKKYRITKVTVELISKPKQVTVKSLSRLKKLKWIVELVKELARGLTQSGRIEILPDDNKKSIKSNGTE